MEREKHRGMGGRTDGRSDGHLAREVIVGPHLAVIRSDEVEDDIRHEEGVDKHASCVNVFGGRSGRVEGGAEGHLRCEDTSARSCARAPKNMLH